MTSASLGSPYGVTENPSLYYGDILSDPYVMQRLRIGIDLLSPYLGGHPKILDIGCYSADLLKLLPSGMNYYGVDFDEGALRIAKGRGARTIRLNLETDPIPLVSKEFDIVIATEILEHLRDPVRMVQQIKRLLAESGVALISLPNECTLYHRLKVLFGYGIDGTSLAPYYHLHFPTIRQSEEFIASHFSIVQECFWYHLGEGLPERFLSKIPSRVWRGVADTYPSLFARGVIFLCRPKIEATE